MKKIIPCIFFCIALVIFSNVHAFDQPDHNIQAIDSLVTKQELRDGLSNLRDRQDIVLKSISESNKYILWIFSILGGIIAIFSFLQTINDRRTMKILEGQIKKSEEITNSYQKNIDSSTRLVDQIEKVVKFQADAQEMMAQIKKLEDKDTNVEEHWKSEITQLNTNAMQISFDFKRRSHNQPSIQQGINSFVDQFERIIGTVDIDDDKFNANCYYIRGIYFRIFNKYTEAVDNFKIAISLANKQTDELLYPLLKKFGVELSFWLSKLQNVCYYHSAIIEYNLGNYNVAIDFFRSAINKDKSDYESMIYIPEAMFLEGENYAFNEIINEFQEVIKIIQLIPQDKENKLANTKTELLSLTYMKLGNCYLGSSTNKDFNSFKDLAKSQLNFEEAYNLNKKSSIIAFSLAQALHMRSEQERIIDNTMRQRYRELFNYAFKDFKKKIGQITEAKILMMYYYMLAICSVYGEIENEFPQIYLMRIFEIRPRLPEYNNLRIYSPLTKNDLMANSFIEEVENFHSLLSDTGLSSHKERNIQEMSQPVITSTMKSRRISLR